MLLNVLGEVVRVYALYDYSQTKATQVIAYVITYVVAVSVLLFPDYRMNGAVVRKAREIYRQRNVIERAINRLKQFRRIATRYEKLAANYTAMIPLACILLWL